MATVVTGTQSTPSVDRAPVQAERLFYVIAAYTMLIVTAVGFQNFYLHGRAAGGEMTAQIVPLIVSRSPHSAALETRFRLA